MADRVKTVSGDAVQDIFDVQHQWVEALVKADTAMLDAILVDSYVDTDEGGSRLDRPVSLRHSNQAISSWRRSRCWRRMCKGMATRQY
jgi:hypothetical protein